MGTKPKRAPTRSSLNQSRQVVCEKAKFVIEVDMQGNVCDIRRNKDHCLSVIAVVNENAVLLEVGLEKHRPYQRTTKIRDRERLEIDSDTLQNVLPAIETILDGHRAVAYARRAHSSLRWINNGTNRYKRVETGVRISVSREDARLLNVFFEADLKYRRATYPLDRNKRLISIYLSKAARSSQRTAKQKRAKAANLQSALEIYNLSPKDGFAAMFVVDNQRNAQILSELSGEQVTWLIPEAIFGLTKITMMMSPRKNKQRKRKSIEKFVSFDVFSENAITMMESFAKIPSLHHPHKHDVASQASPEEIEAELAARLARVLSDMQFDPPKFLSELESLAA